MNKNYALNLILVAWQGRVSALLLSILLSCSSSKSENENKPNEENAKQHIEKAEKDFEQMAADKGIAEAS